VQLIADRVGIFEAWVGDGLAGAFGLYEDALRKCRFDLLAGDCSEIE